MSTFSALNSLWSAKNSEISSFYIIGNKSIFVNHCERMKLPVLKWKTTVATKQSLQKKDYQNTIMYPQ